MSPEQQQKLDQLDKLRAEGVLSEAEYTSARNRLQPEPAAPPQSTPLPPTPPSPLASPSPKSSNNRLGFILVGVFVLIAILVIVMSGNDSGTSDQSVAESSETYLAVDPATAKADSLASVARAAEIAKEVAEAKKTVEKIRPLLSYRKDEFNGGFYYGKSSPRYVNQNGNYVYFSYNPKNSGPGTPRFSVQYYDDDWLFVQRYRFLIDGKEYVYIPDDIKQDSGDGGMIWEWFDEPVNEELMTIIRAIIDSKSAKVRLVGKDYYDDRTITTAQRLDMKRIIAMYDALTVIHQHDGRP